MVWGDEGIFRSSVLYYLASKGDWNVVNPPNNGCVYTLIEYVEMNQPDIVIIVQDFQKEPAHLILRLLSDHPAIKVILLNLQNNFIEVYSKKNILPQDASDLFSVIEKE